MRDFVARGRNALGLIGLVSLLVAFGGAFAGEAVVAVPAFTAAFLFVGAAVWYGWDFSEGDGDA